MASSRGIDSLVSTGPPSIDALTNVVHLLPVRQVLRPGSDEARQEHRMNPLNEPMKVRAGPNRHAYFPRA